MRIGTVLEVSLLGSISQKMLHPKVDVPNSILSEDPMPEILALFLAVYIDASEILRP
jgi:hypothetical protein